MGFGTPVTFLVSDLIWIIAVTFITSLVLFILAVFLIQVAKFGLRRKPELSDALSSVESVPDSVTEAAERLVKLLPSDTQFVEAVEAELGGLAENFVAERPWPRLVKDESVQEKEEESEGPLVEAEEPVEEDKDAYLPPVVAAMESKRAEVAGSVAPVEVNSDTEADSETETIILHPWMKWQYVLEDGRIFYSLAKACEVIDSTQDWKRVQWLRMPLDVRNQITREALEIVED